MRLPCLSTRFNLARTKQWLLLYQLFGNCVGSATNDICGLIGSDVQFKPLAKLYHGGFSSNNGLGMLASWVH
jgi:hypothetical protein